MSNLALVRHGESEWNAKGLWTGWTDIGLSEKGRDEARMAGRKLSGIGFHHGFTSDLSRAWQTLELIKETLKMQNMPTSRHPEFKERHYGIYTGQNKWQIKKKIGEKNFRELRRGWDVPIPEGETLKDVYVRVVRGFENYLLPEIGKNRNLILSAHGNSIRALIKHLENIPDNLISEVEVATGEVIIYILSESGKVINKEKR
ncbi:MAG: phosphoglycerate mutase [Candidatus Gottesmanbacteria bacterium GW2011_GWA2_43_14]|uniref:2,3-bisphosphoglycerate-dependent phosphoglycerate mutase n=1 Tax=Candidatus Gottesmanbacteria bacterium GW2011_GWA2_43_14 TaxID=1618443 RepID=A0A0G1FTG6_9BACT|nr:MAG: phosphoglycerate mutase [Candidatus Gottesmanbacteria bacterium GW2011_GWA2_43_14]